MSARLRPTSARSSSSRRKCVARASGVRSYPNQPCPRSATRRSAGSLSSSEIERGVWALGRLRVLQTFGQRVELALELRNFVAPERLHDGDAFACPIGASVPRHSQRVELLAQPTDSDPEIEPSVRKKVDVRDLFGRVDRAPLRHEADPGPQSDPLRMGRHESQRGERFHHSIGVSR